jgi:hypothetical protein
VLGAADRMGRVDREDAAGDEPVEAHARIDVRQRLPLASRTSGRPESCRRAREQPSTMAA